MRNEGTLNPVSHRSLKAQGKEVNGNRYGGFMRVTRRAPPDFVLPSSLPRAGATQGKELATPAVSIFNSLLSIMGAVKLQVGDEIRGREAGQGEN